MINWAVQKRYKWVNSVEGKRTLLNLQWNKEVRSEKFEVIQRAVSMSVTRIAVLCENFRERKYWVISLIKADLLIWFCIRNSVAKLQRRPGGLSYSENSCSVNFLINKVLSKTVERLKSYVIIDHKTKTGKEC